MVEIRLERVEDVPNCYRVVFVDESGQVCSTKTYSIIYDVESIEIILEVTCGDKEEKTELIRIRT